MFLARHTVIFKQVFITIHIDENRRNNLNNPKIHGELIFKYKLQRTRKQKLFGAALQLPKLIKVREKQSFYALLSVVDYTKFELLSQKRFVLHKQKKLRKVCDLDLQLQAPVG